jgi:hypothetical protein
VNSAHWEIVRSVRLLKRSPSKSAHRFEVLFQHLWKRCRRQSPKPAIGVKAELWRIFTRYLKPLTKLGMLWMRPR